MSLIGSQQAKHKQNMLSLLAKSEAPSHRAGAFSYDRAKTVVTPSPIRQQQVDPVRRLTRWVQAALMIVMGGRLPLDGAMSSVTRAALLQFQKKAGLPQTGAVDDATLKALESMVGLPAPREVHTAPPPWKEPKRSAADPKKPKDTKTNQSGSQGGATASTEGAAQVSHSIEGRTGHHPDGEADAHQLSAAHDVKARADTMHGVALERFLNREALQGVMTLAFAREWIKEELQRSGRKGEAALLSELLAWWERAQGPEQEAPAPWLTQVAAVARDKPAEAAQAVRTAWRDHAGVKN